ncbi:ribose-phosphate pyrophosphokinase [Brevibacillus sp. NPDC058079]|uniref:ribose-phosphate pyrophosphokinase n=1 Tax=Brevibacillus sp. NPDC058079 TaxID=3346330 RepID=UPI0036E94898
MISINGTTLTFNTFPNAETLVDGKQILSLIQTGEENIVVFKYEDDTDLMKLFFVKRFLDDCKAKASLLITYMPYSRMDRKEGDSVFTLKYIASFINDLAFESVRVIEPHSDVTPALIDRCIPEYPTLNLLTKAMEIVGFDKERDYLFFPDAGAQKRYGKVSGVKQLVGYKERDFQSGHIKQLQVVGNVEKPGFKVIIVDDLCSKGGTFMLSGTELRKIGASEVHLLVTHCEKTIFKGDLLNTDVINTIITTDTILDGNTHDKMIVFKAFNN